MATLITFRSMKLILWTFFALSFFDKSTAQNLSRPLNLKPPSIIFNGFSGFRERVPTINNQLKWNYTIIGKEYEIYIEHNGNKDDVFKKALGKMMVNLKRKNADVFLRDIDIFPNPNSIARKDLKLNDTITISNITYIFPDNKAIGYYLISMTAMAGKDSVLENNIAQSIFYDGIYDSLFIAPGKNIIDFAGRKIKINTPFIWRGVNNIHCPEMGQMNWSTHQTLYNAYRIRDIQLIKNDTSKIIKVIKKDIINILFENIEQKALRVTYKANVSRIFFGKGSKILIVYYVVSYRDGAFITTVLSHYDDQLINGDVPPPLSSVMSIRNNKN